jgi:hypothetical protein
MKIQITGDAFVVTSSLSVEDIKTVAKYAPKNLKVVETDEDGNKNEVFAINYNEGKSSIAGFGITFGGKTRDDKALATVTSMIPAGTANAKDYVAEVLGGVTVYLKQLEETVPAKAKEFKDARKTLVDSITVA